MIRYYLDQDPILPNVETYLTFFDSDRKFVLENLDKLVVKSANESGGYGMLMGPQATSEQRDAFRLAIEKNPRNYVAQPMIQLSRSPSFCDDHFEGRHIDLRPYILYGEKVTDYSRRTNARRSPQRLSGRQFLPRRREQGHLGAGRIVSLGFE